MLSRSAAQVTYRFVLFHIALQIVKDERLLTHKQQQLLAREPVTGFLSGNAQGDVISEPNGAEQCAV